MQWKLVASGLALIAATYGLARFGYGLFLPGFAEAFEMGPGLSGVIQAGSFLSYCGTALFAARLGFRPRLVVLLAGTTAALGSAGVALAPNAAVLAGAVVLAGAGAGFATPGLVSLIESNVEARRQENAQAIVNSGTGAGLVAAGVLLILVAGQWRLGWAVIAVVVILATAATLASDRKAVRPEQKKPAPRMPGLVEPALLRRPLIAAGLAGASSAAVWTFGRTVLAAGSEGELHSIAAWMMLGGFGMLGAAAGSIVQAWSLRTAWTTTALLMSGGTLLLPAGQAVPAAGYASAAVFGASYIALSGVLIVWAVRTVPEQGAPGTVFLFIALAVGQAAGSVGLGAVLQPQAPLPAFGLAAAVGLLAIAPVWLRGRTDREPLASTNSSR
ncbi:MFS transporter [Arthrobacter gandavensis]|uniref:MFS transporter n=1 Tax=Arthrobacter gandavensis TaxID=169960 RepID=UPI0018903B8F|nr:MFS transporter [Arthrobacter gandavensis]MBF4994486.1 MFS transporter [Arthrobacter gandavensis]